MPDWFYWANVEYIDRLIKRFLLSHERHKQEAYAMLKTIQPVTEVDSLLREPTVFGRYIQ